MEAVDGDDGGGVQLTGCDSLTDELSFTSEAQVTISWLFFRAASYLTDPLCKAHELTRTIQVLDDRKPHLSSLARVVLKLGMISQLLFYGCLAIPSAPMGIVARKIGSLLQKQPFQHVRGQTPDKSLTDRKVTVLSANVCCVPGGYTISDGGVLPWPERIEQIAQKILKQEADVVCLQEVFDEHAWSILQDKLRDIYPHIYGQMGPRGIGPTSGLMVLSKYEMANAQFVAFPEEMLVGRTKNASKGFFSADLFSEGECFATLITTHLQHSEEPEFPTDAELKARQQEMQLILSHMDQHRNNKKTPVILTGDFNMDDDELAVTSWSHRFIRDFVSGRFSWLGDQFCALLVGNKRVSSARNLDYTLVLNDSGASITTTYLDDDFDPERYTETALSDHLWLFSTISL